MRSANRKARFTYPSHPGYRYALLAVILCILPFGNGESINALAQGRARCRAVRSRVKIEEELRYSLRTLRKAIDSYKIACEQGIVGPLDRKVNDECYPPNLQVLVQGIKSPNGKYRIRYLRQIPVDPTTGRREWDLRSLQDDPQSNTWGGESVFDVYSKSKRRGLDKMPYKEW